MSGCCNSWWICDTRLFEMEACAMRSHLSTIVVLLGLLGGGAQAQAPDPALGTVKCDRLCWNKGTVATCYINMNTADNRAFWIQQYLNGGISYNARPGIVSSTDATAHGGCETRVMTAPGLA